MNGMLRLLCLVLLGSCLAVAAVGCDSDSGGGGTNTDNPSNPNDTPSGPPSSVITGTASGGAPIVGTVYATGSNGGTPVSSPIDVDGRFSLDVEHMDPPYILWAVGDIAGKPGKAYACLGALSTVNVVNITPAHAHGHGRRAERRTSDILCPE